MTERGWLWSDQGSAGGDWGAGTIVRGMKLPQVPLLAGVADVLPGVISVDRLMTVPADVIFAVLADPARHAEFDGSGLVIKARGKTGRQLKLGDTFGMDMKAGLPYSTRNVVTEFKPDRLIAWQTLVAAGPADNLVGGRTWRYELFPVSGGTKVRETWDTSTEGLLSRYPVRLMGPMTERNMRESLDQLAEVVGSH